MKKLVCGMFVISSILFSGLFSEYVYAENIEIVETTENLENPGNADNTGTVDNAETVDNTENVENTEPEKYIPNEVEKLKTTSIRATKVKISWKKENEKGYKYRVYVLTSTGKNKFLGETERNCFFTQVEKNKEYTFRVITVYNNKRLSAEGKTIKFVNKEFVDIEHQKYTYNEMVSDIKSLSKKYGEYMSYSSIGKSEEGRTIYEVVLGNPQAPNCLFITSCLHAREYIASITCMKQIEYYLINYNNTIDGVKPADVFNKCCVKYIVMANPDGVTLAQTKASYKVWKANAKGIDLNRNFPYNFKSYGDVNKGTFTGDEAASAKETKVIIAETEKLKKKYDSNLLILNYHAQGQVLFWDYYGDDSDVANKITQMTDIAQKTTGYRKIISDGEPSFGNYREYVMNGLGIPSITVEVGSGGSPVNKKYYKSTFEKNKFLVLREAQILTKF